jgi:hypothetical protein
MFTLISPAVERWHARCNCRVAKQVAILIVGHAASASESGEAQMMDNLAVEFRVRTPAALAGRTEFFDTEQQAPFTAIPGRGILKLLCNTHHILCLALVVCAYNLAIGIALACYGATIGLVLLSLRLTRERNLRFSFCDQMPEG